MNPQLKNSLKRFGTITALMILIGVGTMPVTTFAQTTSAHRASAVSVNKLFGGETFDPAGIITKLTNQRYSYNITVTQNGAYTVVAWIAASPSYFAGFGTPKPNTVYLYVSIAKNGKWIKRDVEVGKLTGFPIGTQINSEIPESAMMIGDRLYFYYVTSKMQFQVQELSFYPNLHPTHSSWHTIYSAPAVDTQYNGYYGPIRTSSGMGFAFPVHVYSSGFKYEVLLPNGHTFVNDPNGYLPTGGSTIAYVNIAHHEVYTDTSNGIMEFNALTGSPLYDSNGQIIFQDITSLDENGLGVPNVDLFESGGKLVTGVLVGTGDIVSDYNYSLSSSRLQVSSTNTIHVLNEPIFGNYSFEGITSGTNSKQFDLWSLYEYRQQPALDLVQVTSESPSDGTSKVSNSQNAVNAKFILLGGRTPSWMTGVQLNTVGLPKDYRLVLLRSNLTLAGQTSEYQSTFAQAYQNGKQMHFPQKELYLDSLSEAFMADQSGRRISFGVDQAHRGSVITVQAIYQDPQGEKVILSSGPVTLH